MEEIIYRKATVDDVILAVNSKNENAIAFLSCDGWKSNSRGRRAKAVFVQIER